MKKFLFAAVTAILVGCGFDDTASSEYTANPEDLVSLLGLSSSARYDDYSSSSRYSSSSYYSSSSSSYCYWYETCYSSSAESSSSYSYSSSSSAYSSSSASSSSVESSSSISSSSAVYSSSETYSSSSSEGDDGSEVAMTSSSSETAAESSSDEESSSSIESSSSAKSSSSVASSSSRVYYSSSSYPAATERADVPKIEVKETVTVSQTDDCSDCNGFTDKRDGNTYKVVVVNGVAWLAEDLRFAGTDEYPLVWNNWEGVTGRLYTYAAAMNDSYCASHLCNTDGSHYQGACPEGWVLPTATDWYAVETDLTSLNLSRTGETDGSYLNNDRISRYWSSSDNTSASNGRGAIEFYLSGSSLSHQDYDKKYGYGVRCIAADDVLLDIVISE